MGAVTRTYGEPTQSSAGIVERQILVFEADGHAYGMDSDGSVATGLRAGDLVGYGEGCT